MSDEEVKIAVPETPPVAEDLIKGITEKYQGDFNKLAGAFKEVQGRADKLEQKIQVPAEYKISEELKALDEASKTALQEAARESGLSQSQFDALTKKVNTGREVMNSQQNEQKKALETARKEALGSTEEVAKLKAFYADKLPSKVVEEILKSGSVEEIAELKAFRDGHLNKKSSSGMGDGKVSDNQREVSMEKYHANTARLIEIAGEKRRAESHKFNSLCREENKIALENAELLQEFGPKRPR